MAHRRILAFLLGVALLTSSCDLVRIQGSLPPSSAEASGPIPDRPTCAPKPVRLVFKFDPGTDQADRALIRDAITKARDYLPLRFPRDARWSYLEQHYVCYPKQYWEPVVTTFTHPDDIRTAEYRPRRGIRIYLGSDGWRNSPASYRRVITFHEAYHWFQDLASKNPHSVTAGHAQPLWMVEGSAEWWGWEAAVHFGYFPSMDEARRLEAGALKTDRSDLPKYEFPDEGIFDAYPLFFTAVDELMAAHGGRQAMETYWDNDTSESWRVVFQEAFGISVKKFYAEFAKG